MTNNNEKINKIHPLKHEYPIIIYPSVVEEVGYAKAVLLCRIHYLLQTSWAKENDGVLWISNTYEELSEYSRLSEKTIQRTLIALQKEGILIGEKYNTNKFDQTKWYTLNYEKLAELDLYDGPFNDRAKKGCDTCKNGRKLDSDKMSLSMSHIRGIDPDILSVSDTDKMSGSIHYISKNKKYSDNTACAKEVVDKLKDPNDEISTSITPYASLCLELQKIINSPTPLNMARVKVWLSEGLTPEEIIEVVKVGVARNPNGIKSMSYFDQAISNAKASRERPLPPPSYVGSQKAPDALYEQKNVSSEDVMDLINGISFPDSWKKICERILKRINATEFSAWILPLTVDEYEGDIIISFSSDFVKDKVITRFSSVINDAANGICGIKFS